MLLGGVITASVVLAVSATDRCTMLIRDLRAGAVPTLMDLSPAPCVAKTTTAFGYDRAAEAVVARRDLRQGEVVAAPPSSMVPAVRSGEPVRLTVRVGPVTIERRVTTMQPGKSDGSVFVQADDGEVFAVEVAELSQ